MTSIAIYATRLTYNNSLKKCNSFLTFPKLKHWGYFFYKSVSYVLKSHALNLVSFLSIS